MPSLEEKIGPRQTALLVVDLQNDYCHPDGAWVKATGRPATEPQLQRVGELAAAARRQSIPVVFVQTLTNEWTISSSMRERWATWGLAGACIEGTWGAELSRNPMEADRIVIKYRASGFAETDLKLLLRAKGIQTVVLAGVAITGGLLQTACDALDNDCFVVLASDCILGGTEDELTPLLDWAGHYVGQLVPATEIQACWSLAVQ